jgi:serine/threonine protein kinase
LGFSGTYAYAAPEQLRGAPAARGMDLFAAGLVMYEMLAGRPAFDGTRSKEPQPLSTHCAVPPDVDQLVRRLVEANPAARLESAAQAGRELMNLKSQCIGDETLSSEPIALESDADIGQRWVTNVLGSIVEPKAASSASRGLGRSRFSKLRGFPSITRSVVTRTGWGQTISERLSRARLRGALLGASFAAAAAALAWWFVSLSPPSVVRTDPMSMVRSIPSGGGPDHALLADTNPPPQGATGPTSALASGTAASSSPTITAKDLAGTRLVDESERRPPTGRNSKPARRASESQRSDPLAFP